MHVVRFSFLKLVSRYVCIFSLKGQSEGQKPLFPSPRARKRIRPVRKMEI
jgi:hypothetical protein